MKRLSVAAILTSIVLALGPSARAQDVLSAIPEDVLGYVVLNRLEEANGKLAKLAKQMKTPLPFSPLDFARKVLGFDKGLNSKGTLAVALYPGLDGNVEPVPVIFVPVTNYKDFIDSFNGKDLGKGVTEITVFGEKHAVGQKGNFALLSRRNDTEFLKRAMTAKKSMADSSAALQMWLGDQDVAGVMSVRGLKLVGALARKGLLEAKAHFADLPPEAKFLEGMVDGIIDFTKTVESDVTHLALGGRLDTASNLHFNAQAVFAKGSSFAKAGKGVKALEGGPLAGLPAGPFSMAFGGSTGEEAMRAVARWSMDIVKASQQIPEDKLKKLEKYYTLTTKGVLGMGIVFGVGKADAPLFHGMAAVQHVADSKAYLESYEKGIQLYNEAVKDIKLPGLHPMEIRKTTVGGVNALELTTDVGGGDGIGELEKVILEKMFGPGGKMKVSLAAVDAKTLVMRYTGADGLKESIAAFKKKGLAADPVVAKAASLLPKDAQWAFYLSPSGTIELINKAMASFDAPIQIPAYPQTPPLALAAKLSESGLEVHAVAPAEFLDQLADFVAKVRALGN